MTSAAAAPAQQLAALVRDRAAHALRTGALRPIVTTDRRVRDGGVDFVVRSVSTLAEKDAARVREVMDAQAAGRPANPFLPYEPDMLVCDLPPAHVCLFNKFNVLDRHLLIVTRAFADQDDALDAGDFAALAPLLDALGGLGFYNGGTVAGASQRHKHLQLVPGPLAPTGPPIPMEALLTTAGADGVVPGVPFPHAFRRLDDTAPATLFAAYETTMDAAGVERIAVPAGRRPARPYNLLVTPGWMLVVPRRRECAHGISVNALGFAGSLFVRTPEQMALVEERGPMSVLAAVAGDGTGLD